MIRSLIAIIAGLATTILLTIALSVGVISAFLEPGDPATGAYLAVNLVANFLAGAAGGLVAALVAALLGDPRVQGHVIGLSVAFLLISFPMTLATPSIGQPAWYYLLSSAIGPAGVLVGGLSAIRMGLIRPGR